MREREGEREREKERERDYQIVREETFFVWKQSIRTVDKDNHIIIYVFIVFRREQ